MTLLYVYNTPIHWAEPILIDTVIHLSIRDVFCEAKISNLDSESTVSVQQNISGCKVSVDIPLEMQIIHTLKKI